MPIKYLFVFVFVHLTTCKVRVTGYNQREWKRHLAHMAATIRTTARNQAAAVCVTGAQGMLAMLINGYYVLQTNFYNSRPLYRKFPDEDIWLRFGPDGEWTISSGDDKEKNTSGR